MKKRPSKFTQKGYEHPLRKRGNSGPWRKFRTKFLSRHPLCAHCGRQATVVDHIVPLRYKTATLADLLAVDNCQALCTPCHDAKTAFENRGGPKFCLCGFEIAPTGVTCGKTECADWARGKFAWLAAKG